MNTDLKKVILAHEFTRYEHTLCLDKLEKYNIKSSGEDIRPLGNTTASSLSILSELLDNYVGEYPDERFEKVANLIKQQASSEMMNIEFFSNVYNSDYIEYYKTVFKIIKKADCTFQDMKVDGVCLLPIATESHALYVALNDQFIALSNRGQTNQLF